MGNEGSVMQRVSEIGEQVIKDVMNRSFFPAILHQMGAPNRCTAAKDVEGAETFMRCQIDRASRPQAETTFKIVIVAAIAVSILSMIAGLRIYRFACTIKQMVYQQVSIQVNNEQNVTQNRARVEVVPPRDLALRSRRARRPPTTNGTRETVIDLEDDRGWD